MPTSSAMTTPRKTNHRPGRMPGCFRETAAPAIAVMIGEAENSAMSAAITVRSGDSVIPISRRRPAARTSTVSTVKNANSGTVRTVTASRPASTARGTDGRDHNMVYLFRQVAGGPLERGPRRCRRRRLVRSRYLPGLSAHVPWRPYGLRNGPRLAASRVSGRHRIPVIRAPLSAYAGLIPRGLR